MTTFSKVTGFVINISLFEKMGSRWNGNNVILKYLFRNNSVLIIKTFKIKAYMLKEIRVHLMFYKTLLINISATFTCTIGDIPNINNYITYIFLL